MAWIITYFMIGIILGIYSWIWLEEEDTEDTEFNLDIDTYDRIGVCLIVALLWPLCGAMGVYLALTR